MSGDGAAPAIGVDETGRLPLPWLQATLQNARSLDGAHALLLHGPAGAGHLALALLLAQAWLCERPADGQGGAACGRCGSCHLLRTRVHPDLLLLLPEAQRHRLGWAAEDDARPAKADAKPSKDLKVDQVRAAIAWAQQTSGRGRGKVLLLHPADALNIPAANALLKTLEEPPGALHIVLTSDDPERLLPTLRSRCQRLALALPDHTAALAWLRQQGLAQPEPLLALAGGSPLAALDWAADGFSPSLLAELPRRIAAGDGAALAGRPIPRVLDLLAKLAHDAMAVAVGGAPRFFAAPSLPPTAALPALVAWQRELLRVARHAEHPWSGPLLIDALLGQAAAVWRDAPVSDAGRTARL